MSEEASRLEGPDLSKGVAVAEIADGAMLLGHAQGEAVILVRRGDEWFAVGGKCTHYGGPLAEGLLVDDSVRCPWHHACFSLRTGAPLRAPALDPVPCWGVEQRDGYVHVTDKLNPAKAAAQQPRSPAAGAVVIVGAGAAGNAAAETLRREGFSGPITMLGADDSVPYDRPNLSKSYLAGSAPEDWIPLRTPAFYEEQRIELRLGARVASLDTTSRRVLLGDGTQHSYSALLLATGAEPVKSDLPGADLPHVHYLRTLADARALIAKALVAKSAVIIGASFIGLEVAASLRARDIGVHVIGRESCPMEKVLGAQVGAFFRQLHEDKGVTFHLGTTASSIEDRSVTLQSGEVLPAELVIVGIGVRPAVVLAEQAGLAMDRGVLVDEYLETSVPGIFAAGDIARWPDRLTGESIRVEHWVVAERQGQVAARNMLGLRQRFDAVPFFWTEQYDLTLSYVGHAERWDKVEFDGDLSARDCSITYRLDGKTLAVATIQRDIAGLRAEVELERAVAGISAA